MDGKKEGFVRIGHVSNLYGDNGYTQKISELSSVPVDIRSLNELVDKQWDEKTFLCFDSELNLVEPTENCIRYIAFDTGYVVKDIETPAKRGIFSAISRFFYRETNSETQIYGRFESKYPTDISFSPHKWQGVVIGPLKSILNHSTTTHTPSTVNSTVSFDKFSYVHDDYESATVAINALTDKKLTNIQCKALIGEAYSTACGNDKVGILSRENRPVIAYFLLPYCSADRQKVFVYVERNKRTSPEWFGAYVAKEEELKEEIYSRVHDKGTGRLCFSSKAEVDDFLNTLAKQTMKEVWKFADEEKNMKYSHPILRSYIVYTHYRLMSEDKQVIEEQDKKIRELGSGEVCFNTGLLDRYFRQLFIVGTRKIVTTNDCPVFGKLKWDTITNVKIYSDQEQKLANVGELPKMASYFTRREQIIFDAEKEIKLNDRHIFSDGISRGRIPLYKEKYEKKKSNEEELESLIYKISGEFEVAVKRAALMAKRNYKLAVPQFWRETGEIQFLLPIYLGEEEDIAKPQCALVLKFDESVSNPHYRGATILGLDEAYNNARLIARPDVFWLNGLIGNS